MCSNKSRWATKSSQFRIANSILTYLSLLSMGLGLVGVFLGPVLVHFRSVLPSAEDGVLIGFLIDWVARALSNGHDPWQVPFFFPHLNTLTYSDPYLSTGLLTILIRLWTTDLIVIHNTWLVLGALSMWLAWIALVKEYEYSTWAAIMAATYFTYAPWHWHYTVHLHTFVLTGWILNIWALGRWRRTGQIRWWWWAIAAGLAQIGHSAMSGAWTLTTVLVLLSQPSWWPQLWAQKTQLIQACLLAIGITGLIYLPFFITSHSFGYTRSLRDTAHFAASLDRWWSWDLAGLITALIGLQWLTRTQSSQKRLVVSSKSLILLTGLGLILMLGPALKIHDQTVKILWWPVPMPYALAYYLVPGFQAFRTSSRWIVVAGFGLSWLLARYWSKLRWPTWAHGLSWLCLSLALWLGSVKPWQLYAAPPPTPAIYHQVAKRSEKTLAEFPIYIWSMHPFVKHETDRLAYQPMHEKKLYNGASGFTPPDILADWESLWATFPQSSSLKLLAGRGVQLVVVHFDQYLTLTEANFKYGPQPAPTVFELQAQIQAQPGLQLISCQDQSCLYTIQLDAISNP